jgi:hypothetical protein
MNTNLDNYINKNKSEIKNMLLLMYISDYNYLRDENVAYSLIKHIHINILKEEESNDLFLDSPLFSLIFDIQKSLIDDGILEFYSGSNCSDACDYARIYTPSENITKLTIEATESILKENNPAIALNPYFINNGYCYEIAEEVCENADIQICTILMIEDQKDFKTKILNTLSENTNHETIFNIICAANHEWTYDEESKLHFDSETPFGLKNLDDIPIFSRAIARSVLFNGTNVGGKWTKNYSQLVMDLTIPFVIQNCKFKEHSNILENDALIHAHNLLKKCSPSVNKSLNDTVVERAKSTAPYIIKIKESFVDFFTL